MSRLLALVALAAFATGCGTFITPKQEMQIGSGVHKELQKQYRLVDPSDPLSVWAKDFVKPLETIDWGLEALPEPTTGATR